jgi:tetratricopeptide (TPR) repeat protein
MFDWILAALLANPAQPPLPDAAEPPPASPAQVMALSPELRARLHDEVLAGTKSPRARFNRLLHLVFDPGGLGLAYQDDATRTVAQTYATHTANCLSFTMLFIALAREAGLDAHPQEIRETLAWRQDSGIFYRVDHVNTIVRIGDTEYLVDILRDSVIALDAPKTVSDRRLLAHYYNNLAIADLAQNRIAPAMNEMETALGLDAGYATNWSNAGVIYVRNGDDAAAEKAYAKALALEPNNTSALANRANLAEREGDHASEEQFRRRLDRQQQSDPFFHFLQAEEDEQAGDYAHAIGHYEHAIRLHAGEPRFYAALAHAYALSGDTRSAIRAYQHAEWLSSGSAREDYRKQADALRSN